MIGSALSFVRRELNDFFRKAQGDSRDVVVLSPPAGRDGSSADDSNNHILLTLANVLQETTLRNLSPPGGARRGESSSPHPPISINLQVLVSSNFTDYVTGLDFLADVIAFLQAKPLFDHENSPGLDPRIDKLTFAMLKLGYSEMNHLWGMFGTEYRPSALYEVRMLPLRDPRRPSTQSIHPFPNP